MNKVILMGRLTRDPNVRYTQQNGSQESMCVARYTLAVDRRGARDGQQSADFISCVAFGKNGEFAEKYLKQGTKIVVTGRIQTGSYTNRDGQKVYTTDSCCRRKEDGQNNRRPLPLRRIRACTVRAVIKNKDIKKRTTPISGCRPCVIMNL